MASTTFSANLRACKQVLPTDIHTLNRAKKAGDGDAFSSPTKAPDASDPPNKRARTEVEVVVDIADKVRRGAFSHNGLLIRWFSHQPTFSVA